MSDGLIGIIVVCVTILVLAAMVCWTAYNKGRPDPLDEARQRYLDAEKGTPGRLYGERPRHEYSVKTASYPVHHSGEVPGDAAGQSAGPSLDDAPAPFDPENPPTTKTYRRKPGSTAEVPRCHCHRRPLADGQMVLWWPLPDDGGVRIYCQKEDG